MSELHKGVTAFFQYWCPAYHI